MRKATAPKKLEALFRLFPAALVLGSAALIVRFLAAPSAGRLCAFLGFIYLFPPTLWRLLSLRYEIREGVSYIGKHEPGSVWLIAHSLQVFYTAFPLFERILLVIPGAYSAWLRFWGSRIGRKVYWTPETQIVDRTHLEVGDFAFFGNRIFLSEHIVKRKTGRYLLYFRRVRVGARSFVGFQTQIGPGVEIAPGAQVEAASQLYPNVHVEAKFVQPLLSRRSYVSA